MAEPGSPEDIEALDYINRDPNQLNHAGRTLFHDVIGEPESAHSSDCVWRNSYKCYYIGKDCCYVVLTTICAIPAAFCWGCNFACSTFYHIWCVTPCFFIFNLHFSCIARFVATWIHCCCDPMNESFALVFTKIFIHNVDGGSGYKTKKAEELNYMHDADMNQV